MRCRSVIFDLDGTLIDSLPAVRFALNQILAQELRRPLTQGEVRGLIGRGARVTIEGAFAATGAPLVSDQIEVLLDRYVAAYLDGGSTHTRIFPGVVDTLEALAAAGLTFGICTNKPQATTISSLDSLGLARFFGSIACGDSLPFRKPDGRHVLHVLEELGADSASSAFVGDSIVDMTAARDAEILSIAAEWGYAEIDPCALEADARIASIVDLPDALAHLFDSQLPA